MRRQSEKDKLVFADPKGEKVSWVGWVRGWEAQAEEDVTMTTMTMTTTMMTMTMTLTTIRSYRCLQFFAEIS